MRGSHRLRPQEKTRLKNGTRREKEAITRVSRHLVERRLVLGAFLGGSTSLNWSCAQRNSLSNRSTAYSVPSTRAHLPGDAELLY